MKKKTTQLTTYEKAEAYLKAQQGAALLTEIKETIKLIKDNLPEVTLGEHKLLLSTREGDMYLWHNEVIQTLYNSFRYTDVETLFDITGFYNIACAVKEALIELKLKNNKEKVPNV